MEDLTSNGVRKDESETTSQLSNDTAQPSPASVHWLDVSTSRRQQLETTRRVWGARTQLRTELPVSLRGKDESATSLLRAETQVCLSIVVMCVLAQASAV